MPLATTSQLVPVSSSVSATGAWFVIRWPDDATRVVPLPSGATVRLEAREPFTLVSPLVFGGSAQSIGESSLHTLALALPVVTEIEDHVLQIDAGKLSLLVLPDAGQTTVAPIAALPLDDAHGILANRRGTAVQARAAWGLIASKYDAFLAANLDTAGPGDRRTVIPWIDLTLQLSNEQLPLSAVHVASFEASATSLQWRFKVRHLTLHATLTLGEANAIAMRFEMHSPISPDVRILVRPMLEDRSFHHITQAFTGPEQRLPASISIESEGFRFRLHDGHELTVKATARFESKPAWRYCVPLPFCAARGLEPQTDVFSPGEFVWHPSTSPNLDLTASVDADAPPRPFHESVKSLCLPEAMRQSLDLYLADRSGELTVIAGFPWFLDWGRDSLIFTRGLIAEQRLEEAGSVLRRFASFEANGTLPNLLRGSEVTNRETSDAPLWLVVASGEWIAAGGDPNIDCNGRTLRDILRSIIASTRQQMDATSGLIFSAAHHTWMDTDGPPCTPRTGYPIEIQALWHGALRVVAQLIDPTLSELADRVRQSIDAFYWREQDNFFADCLHTPTHSPASTAIQDDHMRPNQWLAITLGAVSDSSKARRALQTTQCLLVPGGARSLAPREVQHRLPNQANGTLLNDPSHPYWPRYTGPEDLTRKPAYHNGTAWCWQYPLYAECLAKLCDEEGRDHARKLLAATARLWQEGCVGQVPEILDGSLPHTQRGCGAQAWSISEWLRVWSLIA